MTLTLSVMAFYAVVVFGLNSVFFSSEAVRGQSEHNTASYTGNSFFLGKKDLIFRSFVLDDFEPVGYGFLCW